MIVALLLVASEAVAICQDAGTTVEISRCVSTVLARSDDRMTAQWKDALARMRKLDADSVDRNLNGVSYAEALLDSQRKWLAFRDSQCWIEGYRMRGGSGQGYSEGICLIHMTEDRSEVLRKLEF